MTNRSTPRGRSWTGELAELAALFLAAAAADVFATSLTRVRPGAVVLIGLGVLTILAAVVHRWWRHRPVTAERAVRAAAYNQSRRLNITYRPPLRTTVIALESQKPHG